MKDFDVKKEVKAAEETITDTEETKEDEIIVRKETEKKNKVSPIPIVLAFILGISLTLLYFNFNPQGMSEEEVDFKIVESNVDTIIRYTNELCETANVTIFEINNPKEIAFMTYNGNNISAKSMNVNEVCIIYNSNKEEKA